MRIDIKKVNGILSKLLKYSDRYEINIQFWPKQWSIFIAKDGVDLESYGGGTEVLERGLDYLDRINKKAHG
jgi:hypothetical protein